MRTADLARLVALAAMWGASYLFMRYAVASMGPALLIEMRVAIAGAALLAFVTFTGEPSAGESIGAHSSSWGPWDWHFRSC